MFILKVNPLLRFPSSPKGEPGPQAPLVGLVLWTNERTSYTEVRSVGHPAPNPKVQDYLSSLPFNPYDAAREYRIATEIATLHHERNKRDLLPPTSDKSRLGTRRTGRLSKDRYNGSNVRTHTRRGDSTADTESAIRIRP